MGRIHLIISALLLSASALAAQTAPGAGTPAQAGSGTTAAPESAGEEIGPWRLICGDAGAGCVARQTILLEKGPPEISIDLFLTAGPGQSGTLSLVTNLDVRIEPGAGIARSQPMASAPVWHGEFVACGSAGCQANGFFDPDSVYGAEDPVAILVSPEGQTVAVPVSMARVKDALERVKPAPAK